MPQSASADLPEYAGDSILVSLPEGASAEALIASFDADSPLSRMTVEKQTDSYLKLALPAGVAVDEAVDAINSSGWGGAAQPNYYYHTLGTDGQAAAQPTSQGAQPAGGGANSSLGAASLGAVSADSGLSTELTARVAATNDSYYSRQWALESIKAPQAWNLVAAHVGTTTAVTVAVIDSGFYINHVDLKGHVVDYRNVEASSSSMVGKEADHGTHIAGIIGAVSGNNLGIAGVAGNACGLMLLRVSDAKGTMTSDTLVDAYSYILKKASAHNVRVVNMSLGANSRMVVNRSFDPVLYDAIAKARKAGIVTVAAASNEESGFSAPFYAYPGDFDNVLSVINLAPGLNSDGVKRESSSNYNTGSVKTEKNISAPGTSIYSTIGTKSYCYETGTSMASPVVAGVLGLMFTVNPGLTAAQASDKLLASAKDLTSFPASAGWDRYTGWGEVDAAAAVRAAGATTTSSRINVAGLSISVSNSTYTGKARKPAVKVKNGSTTLTEGVDYTIKYRDNTSAGKAAFTIVGKGRYCGIAVGAFSIAKARLKSVALKSKSAAYNGKTHKPKVKTVKVAGGKVSSSNYKVTYWRNGHKTSNFKKRGIITVKVTGKGNCKGTVKKKFRIR